MSMLDPRLAAPSSSTLKDAKRLIGLRERPTTGGTAAGFFALFPA
jgi:hypothetical protein